ncbi:Orotidine 5'-phosphate decarboxylase [Eremomyces bilateralis CBS 781.70]|uniref:Orotidine 5'-phosphate decarboxylase n=1 Tax=Eremomyces bilateralis CBS 781.70 TaxID=1392243 RepID=A0A6G1G1N6_9PEZI|nr:Orotidine 5'-phosphate decarboxylase [Eremomyces bilateralis CBS 781.70]KAF1811836.1 Orotidine 5'-phosphate decarboxylase [Eremomyces bilateralis CBS 781.70]
MSHHPSWTASFESRALAPATPPLTSYLLRLMTIKKSNLCFSADVTTTSELLAVAEEVGQSICLLKTHADIISDFGDRTVRGLRDIAKRKGFLVFEDRKLGDIGSTVQRQYTSGPLSIAKWAEIVNAHIFPGPSIVTALASAASDAIAVYNTAVHTVITSGEPSSSDTDNDQDKPDPNKLTRTISVPSGEKKASIVNISTTIFTRTERISPQPTPFPSMSSASPDPLKDLKAKLGPAPYLRGLLLLAQMSSEGNLLDEAYTNKCLEVARENRNFVLGFVAQRSLNTLPDDNFLVMTPGVQLPKDSETGKVSGDGLGQQYNGPRHVVGELGCDIIIVGRGILNAKDRTAEAERYRKAGWEAYEERIGLK